MVRSFLETQGGEKILPNSAIEIFAEGDEQVSGDRPGRTAEDDVCMWQSAEWFGEERDAASRGYEAEDGVAPFSELKRAGLEACVGASAQHDL